MSAFIVSDQCMNLVVSHLVNEAGLAVYQRKFAGVVLTDPGAGQRITDQLAAMNHAAVTCRYGKGSEMTGGDLPPAYRYCHVQASPVVYLKALQCLLYQCAEGDIDETPLYQELDAWSDRLAHKIAFSLPEYQKAPWG